MQRLFEIASRIKNKDLKEKVTSLLKEPKLTHKDFMRYEAENIDKVKTLFSLGGAGTVEREDLITHTTAVTELCIKCAETLKERYNIEVDMDCLIAGALLHDVMKVFEWKNTEKGVERSDILLDHSILATAELYVRNFPEKVIHIVASHIGESGPTPPRNFEALILHHMDMIASIVEFYTSSPHPNQTTPILVIDEDTIKKLSGES